MTKNDKSIAVIGAGVGGLSAAARLAYQGYSVDVYEKMPHCGGRANVIKDQGFTFDTGPSFVLMPDFFEEIFDYCREDIKDYLDLKKLDVSYKIFYSDGDAITIHGDTNKTKEEFEKKQKGASGNYDSYLKEMEAIYKEVRPLLYKCFTPSTVMNPYYWKLLYKLKALSTYWKLTNKHFKNEKICYAMTFQSMFIGVSPFLAPAFYSVITYADHVQKVYHPMGGMHEIPKALERLGKKFGVRYHYNSEINSVKELEGRVQVKSDSLDVDVASAIINADYPYAKEKLLNKEIKDYEYSCSVYLMYLGLKKKVKGLEHHTLFLAKDVKQNLVDIFKDQKISLNPSFYVHVPTVTDASLAPDNQDLLYILVPIANNKKREIMPQEYEDKLRKYVFDKLKEVTGEDIESLITVEHKFTPKDFVDRYNLKFGSAFGLAHTLFQSAFFRPANQDSKNSNVYYVGASTQPGGGLPPVIASSRIVADMIAGTHVS